MVTLLSLSFWEDEESISKWRNLEEHRNAQFKGRNQLFQNYRIRACKLARDYTLIKRLDAPSDSNDLYS
jgi:heme-degrading monooxygenase HmoA